MSNTLKKLVNNHIPATNDNAEFLKNMGCFIENTKLSIESSSSWLKDYSIFTIILESSLGNSPYAYYISDYRDKNSYRLHIATIGRRINIDCVKSTYKIKG